ncbi:CA174 protein, partial [Galbula dea]|nr:CA174 protein [Galbula dea]
SPHKVAGRRPSKKLKCEKNSTVKSELEGLPCGSGNLAALGEIPKASDGAQLSEDPGDHNRIQQKKSESIPEAEEDKQEKEQNVSLKPHAVKPNRAPSKLEGDGDLHVCTEEERSSESLLSEGSSVEDADLPKKLMQLDSSAFLNEDSNQPMPVARFFGDVETVLVDLAFSLQDLPAAAVPSTRLSRREYRRLHFIAKEEEEEEEEDVL